MRWKQRTNGHLSTAQDILRKSTDFLRRVTAPKDGVGGVTLSDGCLHCRCFPHEDCIWWVSSGHGKKQCNWWGAACGGQYDWRAPNRLQIIQDSADPREAKVFRAHTVPEGMCDNLTNSLKLLTHQQKDGDTPVGKVVTGLWKRTSQQCSGRAQEVHCGGQL